MKFTSAGITIAAVEGVPSAFDKAGFSVMPFVDIGQVSNIPAFGPTVQVVESNTLATGITEKYVGFVNYGSVAIEADYDDGDLGQELVSDAVTTTDPSFGKDFSFELTYPNGSKRYWVGKFFSATESPNSANSMVSTSMNVEINSPILKIEQWVAQLDGVTQYWQFTEEIPLPIGYSYEMAVLYDADNQSTNDYLATGEGDTNSPLFFVSREFLDSGSVGRLSAPVVDGGNNRLPYDNNFHTVVVTSLSSQATVGILGARFNYTRTSSGIIKLFRVRDSSGTVINEIPLTNKAQGATQLATVGNVNAFMANYTEAVWRKL